jgi:4a-hydroxytetrahydrobiopterin dehydratase
MPEPPDPATLDPAKLASMRCEVASADTRPLTAADIDRLRTGIDAAWRVDGVRLVREFRVSTFGAAFGLATRIALLAEGQNHHPTMTVGWGRLTVTWTTEAIGAISANDLIMTAKVDRLVERGFALKDE